MKMLFLLGLCLLFSSAHSQHWKDTLNRARKLYEQGNYKEALKYYKSAEQIAPKDVDLSIEKGQTAYKAGEYKTAAESYQQIVANSSESEQKQKMRSNLGESQMMQQNYQGAVDTFKEVLRHDSGNEKARQRLMEAQRMLKQQQKQQEQKQQQNNNQNKDDTNKQQNNNQNKQNNEQNKGQQKLQDKATERKLDELSKQEQEIKKRLNGSKGKKRGGKGTKDW